MLMLQHCQRFAAYTWRASHKYKKNSFVRESNQELMTRANKFFEWVHTDLEELLPSTQWYY